MSNNNIGLKKIANHHINDGMRSNNLLKQTWNCNTLSRKVLKQQGLGVQIRNCITKKELESILHTTMKFEVIHHEKII